MGIKKELDEFFGVTDDDVDALILEQKIEEEEKKIKILKELVGYKSFRDYTEKHPEEFEDVDITDDFNMIIIPGDKYPDIDLDKIKKIGWIADHFGIFIYVSQVGDEIKKTREEIKNGKETEKKI